MADVAMEACSQFVAGVIDAVSFHKTVIFFVLDDAGSKAIKKRIVKCAVLNGVIFLGSLIFFEFVVMRVIHLFRDHLVSMTGATAETWSQHQTVGNVVDGLVFCLYQTLWTVPIYCLSFILNMIWYQEIADHAFAMEIGKPKAPSVKRTIVNEIFGMLVRFCVTVQTIMMSQIPIVGKFISFAYLSWSFSLYCFDYKWSQRGWNIEKRFEFLENNWAFFAGFGSPCTLVTIFFPHFIGYGVYALLFPLFLLLAMKSETENKLNEAGGAPPCSPLPLLLPAKRATDKIIRIFGRQLEKKA
jgi:etoposide-induced 2.4 mRNA